MANRRVVLSAALVLGAWTSVVAADGAGPRALRCVPGIMKLSLGPTVSPMTGEHADLFELTNRSKRSCVLDGYPRVSLSHQGKRLAFVYLAGGGPYVTRRKPQRITLGPGRHAYFIVAKYRCDGGVRYTTTSMRVLLPETTGALTLDLSEQGVGGLDYCKLYPGDQPVDPGNRVTVSPLEASLSAAQSGT